MTTVAAAQDWLSKAAPAQTLLLLKPHALQRELLQYTLADMFFRNVLRLIDFDTAMVGGRPRLRFTRVGIGEQFGQGTVRLHEMTCLFPFYKKPAKKIAFIHLLQMMLQASKNEAYLKWKLLLDEEYMAGLFYRGFFQKIFGGMKISSFGKQMQQHVIVCLNAVDRSLSEQLRHDRQQALTAYKTLQGNLLLLNAFKFELVFLIGKELAALDDELETGTSVVPE